MDFISRRRTKTPTCFMRNEVFWEETSSLPLRSPLYLHYLHFHFLAQRKGTPDETSPLVAGTDWQCRTLLWKAPLKRSPPFDTIESKRKAFWSSTKMHRTSAKWSKTKMQKHNLTELLAIRSSCRVYRRIWQYISDWRTQPYFKLLLHPRSFSIKIVA